MENKEFDLFISYQWDIQSYVLGLRDLLEREKYKVWMDKKNMNAGSGELSEKLSQSIKKSRALVCCITNKYDKSLNCQNEISFASSIKIPIIVLMFEYNSMKKLKFMRAYIENIHRNNIYRDPSATKSWKGVLVDSFMNDVRKVLNENSSIYVTNNKLKYLPHIETQSSFGSIKTEEINKLKEDEQCELYISYEASIKDKVDGLQKFLISKRYSLLSCANLKIAIESNKLPKAMICCITKKYSLSSKCIDEITYSQSLEDSNSGKKNIPMIVIMFENISIGDLNSVGFFIAKIHRNNLFNDKQAMESWQGPLIDKLVSSIDETLQNKSSNLEAELYRSNQYKKFKDRYYFAHNSQIKALHSKRFELIRDVSLEGHSDDVTCLELINDNVLASGSSDETIRVWCLNTGNCIQTLDKQSFKVECLKMIDNKRLMSGCWDNYMRVWEFCDIKEQFSLKDEIDHKSPVFALEMLNDRLLASVSASEHIIRIWDVNNFSDSVANLIGHNNCIYDLKLVDEDLLASVSIDGILKFWDTKMYKCIKSMCVSYSHSLECVSMLSENLIAIGNNAGFDVFSLDDILSKAEEEAKPVLKENCGTVSHLRVLNEKYFVIKCEKSIQIWELNTLRCEKIVNL